MRASDSLWHEQLSQMTRASGNGRNPYWLVPFENYKTFCPYLVSSYSRVAQELARYIRSGYRSFILDIPPDEEELHHSNIAFARAREQVAQ